MEEFVLKLNHLLHNNFWSFGLFFSFVIGSCVGSFLNVCIWRIPRGESVSHPPSHCPKCGYQIPAYENIPIIAWLMLRGKCKNCSLPISPRYIILEGFVGLLFVWVTYQFLRLELNLAILLFFYSMCAVFVTVSFIDIEHYRIPDKINIYAAITVLPVILWSPGFFISNKDLMIVHRWLPFTQNSHAIIQALVYSVLGAFCSFFILWTLVYCGRLFKKTQEIELDDAIEVKINEQGIYSLEDGKWEESLWKDIALKKDEIISYQVEESSLNFNDLKASTLTVDAEQKVLIGEQSFDPSEKEISFKAKAVTFPIDVTGQGDLKYVLVLGAFLGPQMGILSIIGAAFLGVFVGILQIIKTKKVSGALLPFGPFLSASAFLCLLYREEILDAFSKLVS